MSGNVAEKLEPTDGPLLEIGVVVLTYNQENLLGVCLDSIISQKLKAASMRIYVIDDASTDSTADVVQTYAKLYPGLIFPTIYDKNQYQNGNAPEFPVIEGIDASHIAFCDGDDYWIDEYKLEKQIKLFIEDRSIAIVHTDYFLGMMKNGSIIHHERTQRDRSKALKVKSSTDLIQGNDIKKSTGLYRKSAIDFNFLRKCFGVRAQDWIFAISAGSNGGIVYIDEQTTCYRVSSEASFQKLDQKEKMSIKDEVRWFCATNLPESELRNDFRKYLLLQHFRFLISRSPLYQKVSPFVKLYRNFRSNFRNFLGK